MGELDMVKFDKNGLLKNIYIWPMLGLRQLLLSNKRQCLGIGESTINGRSIRLYHNGKKNDNAPRAHKRPRKWNLIDESDHDASTTTNRADPTGIFTNDRPSVPANWRKIKTLPPWKRQMFALREKFHDKGSWSPSKKLSREAMDGIRSIKDSNPELSSGDIASYFKVSPEAIRRILRSKWRPSPTEQANLSARWERRGQRLKEQKQGTDKQPQKKPTSSTKKRGKNKKDIGDMYF